MAEREVYIVGAARTPIGAFLGTLSPLPAVSLGASAIRAALERSGLDAAAVDEALMGHVLTAGAGQAPARQAAKAAGLSDGVPTTTLGKVCGSGLQSAIFGTKSIALGDAEVVVAGGMESMSQAPYLMPGARTGLRLNDATIIDSMMHDGLWDPYHQFAMGSAAELCAKDRHYSREAQDEFAIRSYQRALAAQENGEFAEEIVAVEVPGRKGETTRIQDDEEPRRANFEKMPKLKPAFEADGTITAANASKLNDGAAAVVLASGQTVRQRGLQPLARVVAYAQHALAPEWFTLAPLGAIEAVLRKAGLDANDIDLWEVNEAFAVVAMAAAEKLGIDADRLNVRGGAIALGHPLGASGARVLVTLLHAMKSRGARRGLATLCIGGGEAVAMVVERSL